MYQYVVDGKLSVYYATKQETVERYLREKFGKNVKFDLLQVLENFGEEEEE